MPLVGFFFFANSGQIFKFSVLIHVSPCTVSVGGTACISQIWFNVLICWCCILQTQSTAMQLDVMHWGRFVCYTRRIAIYFMLPWFPSVMCVWTPGRLLLIDWASSSVWRSWLSNVSSQMAELQLSPSNRLQHALLLSIFIEEFLELPYFL